MAEADKTPVSWRPALPELRIAEQSLTYWVESSISLWSYHCPITSEAEHLFMLSFMLPLLQKDCLYPFCLYFYWVLFFLLIHSSVFCILDPKPLSVAWWRWPSPSLWLAFSFPYSTLWWTAVVHCYVAERNRIYDSLPLSISVLILHSTSYRGLRLTLVLAGEVLTSCLFMPISESPCPSLRSRWGHLELQINMERITSLWDESSFSGICSLYD